MPKPRKGWAELSPASRRRYVRAFGGSERKARERYESGRPMAATATVPLVARPARPRRLRARDVKAVRLTTDRVVNKQDASGAWSYRRVRRWTATLLDGSTTVLDYDPTG